MVSWSSVLAQSDEEIVAQFDDVGWQEWLIAVGIVVGGVIVGRIVSSLVQRAAGRTGAGDFVARLLGRLAFGMVLAISLWFALATLGVQLGPLIGALGIAGLALAFAFQDILENVIAGLLMLMRRPISVGDEVETNEYAGTVTDMTMRALEVTTFDGETVYVPNAMVWKSPLTNLTKTTTRRTTLDVGVGYDADLDEVKELLERTARSVDGVAANPVPKAFVHEFGDSSINFAVMYWHDARMARMWSVRDELARTIKRELDAAGVDIPFPQRVVHLPRQEP